MSIPAILSDNLELVLLIVLPMAMLVWMTWIYGHDVKEYHQHQALVWRGAAVHALALVLPTTIALFTMFSVGLTEDDGLSSVVMIGGALTLISVLLPFLLTRDMQFHLPIIGRWLLAYQLASSRRSFQELKHQLPVMEQLEWDLYGGADK